jgi:hypothetical protein
MSMRSKRVSRRGAALVVVLAAVGAIGAGPAWGAFGITTWDGIVADDVGGAYSKAGGHPTSASATFQLNRTLDGGLIVPEGGDLRNARADLPPGFIGNPTAVPRCPKTLQVPSNNQALSAVDLNDFCPINTIVGTADVTVALPQGIARRFVGPIFNLEPPPGVAAQFGFSFSDQKVVLDAIVRNSGDYGVSVIARNANQIKPVLGTTVTLWGVPADHSHDNRRCLTFLNPGNPEGHIFTEDDPLPVCQDDLFTRALQPWNAPNAANLELTPFLTNPTACTPVGVGLPTTLSVDSWNAAAAPDQSTFMSHEPPGWPLPPADWGPQKGPDECDKVPFDPVLDVKADTTKADAPTGLEVDLSFPQGGLASKAGTATGHLKRATVTLPEGWTVSPSSADGLAGCSDAESSVGTDLGARCPDAAKIGSVEATTPLLDEKLSGGVYVGTQESDDPLSGRMYRMFIALTSEERGVRVKLPGQIRINPDTGRIETTFDNNPQVPVSQILLKLRSGPRAPLATPFDCGTKSVVADLESWSGAVVTRTSDLTIACPGVGPLAPAFNAGVTENFAGRHTNFALRVSRPDGQQVIDGLSLRLPPGLLAKIKGVPQCSDAAANAGVCPESSRVGTTTVGAGPGPNPFFLQGGVYFTGPYKRGPYGLAVAVRAKAGPFDLGTVVVRQQLLIDPVDAHVDVVSDPLPTILKGVPVRLRSLNVDVDRKDYILNPTSCAQKTILATFGSPAGSVFSTQASFGVSNCAALPLKPKLKIALTGRKQTTEGKHPGVKAIVLQRRGDANLKRVAVKLPLSLALDPDNAQALCEFKDGTKVDPVCPKGSIVGSAKATTPLLDQRLTGPVYFVKNIRIDPRTGRQIRTLPMLVIPLRGGGVKLNLKGTSDVSRSHLVNTFNAIPDAPVTRFDLKINGGKNGILASNANLCRGKHVARATIDGQNNKPSDRNVTLAAPCKKAPARGKKK